MRRFRVWVHPLGVGNRDSFESQYTRENHEPPGQPYEANTYQDAAEWWYARSRLYHFRIEVREDGNGSGPHFVHTEHEGAKRA